jgi:hypothetical protein
VEQSGFGVFAQLPTGELSIEHAGPASGAGPASEGGALASVHGGQAYFPPHPSGAPPPQTPLQATCMGIGTQLASALPLPASDAPTPHMFGPPPPQNSPCGQPPHWRTLPQPSPIAPHSPGKHPFDTHPPPSGVATPLSLEPPPPPSHGQAYLPPQPSGAPPQTPLHATCGGTGTQLASGPPALASAGGGGPPASGALVDVEKNE